MVASDARKAWEAAAANRKAGREINVPEMGRECLAAEAYIAELEADRDRLREAIGALEDAYVEYVHAVDEGEPDADKHLAAMCRVFDAEGRRRWRVSL